jgi:hypothetical protein
MILDIYSVLGWAGAILIILAYIFLSTKKLKKEYVLYHLLNFFGAAGLILSTFTTESWPALALSLILAAISIGYIIKILSVKPSYKELRIE